MALRSRYYLATAEGQLAADAYAMPSGARMQAVSIDYARTAKRGPGVEPGNWWTSGDGQPNPCIARLTIEFQGGTEKLAAGTATAMIDAARACVALIRVDGQGNVNTLGTFVLGTHVLAREIRMPILGMISSNRDLLPSSINRLAYEIALSAGHDRWNVAHDYSGLWTEF
jgi:hypothetical protein